MHRVTTCEQPCREFAKGSGGFVVVAVDGLEYLSQVKLMPLGLMQVSRRSYDLGQTGEGVASP